ncbi:MAG: O-antigen ligase family protein [Anaerolineae bacterium]|nr:MAG: O-antigen ligase family protein [Anaerolineae bacterium]
MTWAWKPSLGWVLALSVAPWAVQALTRHLTLQRTFLDIPLALFLLTAGIGLWASYDRDGLWAVFSHPIGWQKLWGLSLAALLYYAVATSKTPIARCWAIGALAGLGALVAAIFIATHDWTAEPAKWEPIAQLGKMIQLFLPPLPGGILNPNVSAGIIAPLLPLSLGLVARARGREQGNARLWIVWGLTTGFVMTLGLVLTASRGAWVGLGGGTTLAVTWWLTGKRSRGKQRLVLWAALTLLEGLAVGLALVLVPTLRATIVDSYTVTNRLSVFSQAALLVRDYPFTGCGLGNFALVHSTYALLIHVPILSHAHALLLNVAVEQGILGALAVVITWIGAGWLGLRELAQEKEPRPMLTAALLSLVVLIIHGLVDDALYSSRGVLLLWAPAGAIVAALPHHKSGRSLLRWWLALAVVATLSLGLMILLAGRAVAATWNANLGAVDQTKVELQAYDYKHFDKLTLDQVRQWKDLSVAEGHFSRALAFNPGQATARTRSAAIALSRMQYGQALFHTQTARRVGYRDRVTRLLLGDALVATGQTERAAEMVRGLAWAEERLEGQAWYRYWVNGDYQRAADAWRTVVALNPQNENAANWLIRAEERMGTP